MGLSHSGESGAGKTENTKKVIMYFAKVAAALQKMTEEEKAAQGQKVSVIMSNCEYVSFKIWIPLFGFRQAKICLRACAKCAESHPAHAQRLIRAFALHWSSLWCPMILFADSEGPDQTARMRRLIWAFDVHICPKTCFSHGSWHLTQRFGYLNS